MISPKAASINRASTFPWVMLTGSKSPSKAPTPLTSQQVTTKLCTVVYSLGFNAARSGCPQTPKWSPYCRAQQCVPWEMRATITSSQGHLFKDNKPGLSMLGFYGVVPALKATTGANPAPTLTHTPPFGCLFLSVNLSLGKSTDPPTDTHTPRPPPPGPQGMRSSLWKLVGQPEMPTVGETQTVTRNFSGTKKKIYCGLGLENCSVGKKTTQPC